MPTRAHYTLEWLIEKLIDNSNGAIKTHRDVARMMEISGAALSQAMNPDHPRKLSIKHCLMLACALGMQWPDTVLRAAGHKDIAELLAEWRPRRAQPGDPVTLTPIEQEHMQRWRLLPDPERRLFETCVQTIANKAAVPTGGTLTTTLVAPTWRSRHSRRLRLHHS